MHLDFRKRPWQFLHNTGAELCVIQQKHYRGPCRSRRTHNPWPTVHPLQRTVATLTLNLNQKRDFPRRFLIAGVSKSIIRADCLFPHRLLIDLKSGKLLNRTTRLCAWRRATSDATPHNVSTKITSGTETRAIGTRGWLRVRHVL